MTCTITSGPSDPCWLLGAERHTQLTTSIMIIDALYDEFRRCYPKRSLNNYEGLLRVDFTDEHGAPSGEVRVNMRPFTNTSVNDFSDTQALLSWLVMNYPEFIQRQFQRHRLPADPEELAATPDDRHLISSAASRRLYLAGRLVAGRQSLQLRLGDTISRTGHLGVDALVADSILSVNTGKHNGLPMSALLDAALMDAGPAALAASDHAAMNES